MTSGTIWGRFVGKTRGQKSRAIVPLNATSVKTISGESYDSRIPVLILALRYLFGRLVVPNCQRLASKWSAQWVFRSCQWSWLVYNAVQQHGSSENYSLELSDTNKRGQTGNKTNLSEMSRQQISLNCQHNKSCNYKRKSTQSKTIKGHTTRTLYCLYTKPFCKPAWWFETMTERRMTERRMTEGRKTERRT